jgi:hypothetical protein
MARNIAEQSLSLLFFEGPLDVIDDQEFAGSGRLRLQPELFLGSL